MQTFFWRDKVGEIFCVRATGFSKSYRVPRHMFLNQEEIAQHFKQFRRTKRSSSSFSMHPDVPLEMQLEFVSILNCKKIGVPVTHPRYTDFVTNLIQQNPILKQFIDD